MKKIILVLFLLSTPVMAQTLQSQIDEGAVTVTSIITNWRTALLTDEQAIKQLQAENQKLTTENQQLGKDKEKLTKDLAGQAKKD